MPKDDQVIRVGDIGTVLRRRVRQIDETGAEKARDISDDTVVFRFTNPASVSVDVDATVSDGPRGYAVYVLEDGVLDVAGTWRWAAIVTTTGGEEWESNAIDLAVEDGLPAPE